MAKKAYITIKKINEVLSLYGVVMLKEYMWNDPTSPVPDVYHWYITALEHEHTHAWEVPRYYLPDTKSNQQRLEFALEDIHRVTNRS